MITLRSLATCVALTLLAACASKSSSTRPTTTTSSSDVITTAEVDATPVSNAYDLVNRLRPRWLTGSGSRPSSIAGGRVSTQVVLVYLDGSRLGSIEALRSISAPSVKSLRWYDATRAATVLRDPGTEPIAGAIVLTSRTR